MHRRPWLQRDFRLLCTDGCFPLDDYERPECQTGQSASQAVVVRPGLDSQRKEAVKAALQEYKPAGEKDALNETCEHQLLG